MADNDTQPLNMLAPPWWDAWQRWANAQVLPPGHPTLARFIEHRDPRAWMHTDDLAYEVGIEAFGAGYEVLLEHLARALPKTTLYHEVARLVGELRAYRDGTGQPAPETPPPSEAPPVEPLPDLVAYGQHLGFDTERVRREFGAYLEWLRTRQHQPRDHGMTFHTWLRRARKYDVSHP